MRLTSAAVQRPVATLTLFAAAVLLGVISLSRLEFALFPEAPAESVSVWVAWPGAGVRAIEDAVARPVEVALVGATGVRGVRSTVVVGGVTFHARLHPGAHPRLALVSIREKLDTVRWSFPSGVERPLVLGGGSESDAAFVLALASHDLPAAAEWAESILSPRLEQLEGISRALVVGEPRAEITITPDLDAMRQAGLSVADLASAIRAADVEAPGGTLRQRSVRFSLRVDSRLLGAEDLAAVPVPTRGGAVLRLADVAKIEEGFEPADGHAELDGRPAVGLLVYRQPGENLLRVADRLRDELAHVESEFPDLNVRIVADSSPFVRQAVSGVGQAIGLGGLLALAILWVFLRGLRAPLLLSVALPTSVVVTFLALDALDVSLNLMSLGGLALGIGMLVDNGIVCLENIDRLRAEGKGAHEAAAWGARQIAFPILASTLTTCAVFVPLAFVPGAVGLLCRDLALAVSVSLGVSWIVAMTLLPMLAARFPGKAASSVRRPGYRTYRRGLAWVLRRPGPAVGLVALGVLASAWALTALPREILPALASDHVDLGVEFPAGVDVDRTAAAATELADWLARRPDVETVFATAGDVGTLDPGATGRLISRGRVRAKLTQAGARGREALLAEARAHFAGRDFTLAVHSSTPEFASFWGGDDPTLICEVVGTQGDDAEAAATRLAARVRAEYPELAPHVELVVPERQAALHLAPRADVLARFGLREEDLVPGLEARTSGHEVLRIARFEREIPVRIRTAPQDPRQAVLMAAGRAWPVPELFDVTVRLDPARQERDGQARVTAVHWTGPLRDAPAARRAFAAAASGDDWPAGVTIAFGGNWRRLQATLNGVGRAFLMSLGLVFLVLAAQFESLRLPWFVVVAVPLALPGVLAALLLSGSSVNVMAGVGLVVLVGIAVNDAILKVDIFRRQLAAGASGADAVHLASEQRFRPIVMTTLTTGLGLVPMFFGRGAELRAPLAAVVLGGLAVATVLTMLILPVCFARFARSRAGRRLAEAAPVALGGRA